MERIFVGGVRPLGTGSTRRGARATGGRGEGCFCVSRDKIPTVHVYETPFLAARRFGDGIVGIVTSGLWMTLQTSRVFSTNRICALKEIVESKNCEHPFLFPYIVLIRDRVFRACTVFRKQAPVGSRI